MLKMERARHEDAGRIADCAREAYQNIQKKYGFPLETYPSTEIVASDIKNHIYYKILLEDDIIGGIYCVMQSPTHFLIEDLCILPQHQNKGYGQWVLTEIETLHPDVTTWELWTPLYQTQALHMYQKMDYVTDIYDKEKDVAIVSLTKEIIRRDKR